MNELNDKTIFRRAKDRDNPYAMIDRAIFEDEALSWKAKGLLGYLLSRPDDWVTRMSDLKKRSKDGIDGTRSAVCELESAGYLKRYRERDEQGQFKGFVVEVHEIPVPEDERTSIAYESPPSGFPRVEKPALEKPTQENPVITNKDCTETNVSIDIPGDSSPFLEEWEEEAQLEQDNLWRKPQQAAEVAILASVGRTRYDTAEEMEGVKEVLYQVSTGALPEKYLKSRLWCAKKHKWPLATLIKSALSPESLEKWQKKQKRKSK